MKVVVEKMINKQCEREYKVVAIEDIDGLPQSWDDVPNSYNDPDKESLFRDEKALCLKNGWTSRCIKVGSVLSENKFTALIEVVKSNLQRLDQIDAERRQLEANWHGEHTYIL